MRRLALLGLLSILIPIAAPALPSPEGIKLVPVHRLYTNLQSRLSADTNSFALTYQMARLSSLVYATNLMVVPVREHDDMPDYAKMYSDWAMPRTVRIFKTPADREQALRHLTNAVALFERALDLLKKSVDPSEAEWLVPPTQLGLAWCLHQSGQKDQALDAYRKALGIAWHMEVTKNFDFQKWVSGAWDSPGSGENLLPDGAKGPLGMGVSYSQEIIGYLLRLLDPTKDSAEISRLRKLQQVLKDMPRAYSPILVPLKAGLAFDELINLRAGVPFDLDGSGLPRKWGWITPNAAWLVYDADGSGQITSGLQLFGNVTFWIIWRDGYAALAGLDDNADGFLDGTELKGLALWCDVNGNGVSEPGEVRPVAESAITRIACSGESFSGDTKWNSRGVTFSDGSTRPSYDWISPSK